MSFKDFRERALQAISTLKSEKIKEVLVVHHDDGDGISSGAITKACLEREGYAVQTLCLEKVYPEVIEDIHSQSGRVIFYSDIGSSHGDFISECNVGKNLVIILDHHDPMPATDPRVVDLNLEHFGFKGETDFSGSTCCYLFAKELNGKNIDLAYLALVGSCEIPEGFISLNKSVLDEALREGIVRRKGKSIEISKLGISINVLFSALQILGAVGYYEGGPDLGVEACLKGITNEVKEALEKFEKKRKEANRHLLAKLYREGLRETEHVQYFDAGEFFRGMGTKVIGSFSSFLSFQARLVKDDKYILGFIDVPLDIPRWGKLKEKSVKVSVRVPKPMQKLIEEGKLPSAVDMLREASKDIGGVADGHAFAANCVFPAEAKATFIDRVEKAIASCTTQS